MLVLTVFAAASCNASDGTKPRAGGAAGQKQSASDGTDDGSPQDDSQDGTGQAGGKKDDGKGKGQTKPGDDGKGGSSRGSGGSTNGLVFNEAGVIPPDIQVNPKSETESTGGDADDPAIWIDKSDPARSLIFGTDKQNNSLSVFDLQGKLVQQVDFGAAPNNVDIRQGYASGGRSLDVVVVNLRNEGKLAVMLVNPNYDPAAGDALKVIADASSSGNDIQKDSYALALCVEQTSKKLYVFDRPKESGSLVQFEISIAADDKVTVTALDRVIESDIGTNAMEGAVCDDANGFLYVSEEATGIKKYHLDPEKDGGVISLFAEDDGIEGDREGLAIYHGRDGDGYLLLSSQGNHTVKVYDRNGDNAFITTINTVGSGSTDGLDVTSVTVPGFKRGFLVKHDSAGAKYVFYDWEDITPNE